MRLLHTSDWHLGRNIRGRSRAGEFQAVLDELCGIARDEEVDVVVVAGDIWDAMSPSPEADRLLFGTLRQLIEAKIEVVLVGGNHDHPRRLNAFAQVGELVGVRAIGEPRPWDDGGTITIERGGERLRLAAVPWVREGRALRADEILGPEFESFQQYARVVEEVYTQAAKGFEDGALNVFASHVFIDDARVSLYDGSERRIHIGQTYAVPAAALPSYAQYSALGHVHEPQVIEGSPNHASVYSGSLLQLDFGERKQQKSVRIVDLEAGRPAKHRAVPLTAGKRLEEVSGTFDEVIEQGLALPEAHLRAVVHLATPEAGVAQRVRTYLENCVDVKVEIAAEEREIEESALESLGPVELFEQYFRDRHSAEPSKQLTGLFRELLDEVTAGAQA